MTDSVNLIVCIAVIAWPCWARLAIFLAPSLSRHVIHTTFIVLDALSMRQVTPKLKKLLLILHKWLIIMPFLYQYCVVFGQCVSLKIKKVNITTLSGTLGWPGMCIASFCMCAYCLNQTKTPVMWWIMLQKSQKQPNSG